VNDVAREVVVVGAGVAGTSAAIEVAKRGLSVTLVDEHPLDLATMTMDAPFFFGPRLTPTLADRGLMMQRIVAANKLLEQANEVGVKVLLGTCGWGSFRPGENSRHLEHPCVGLANAEQSWTLEYEHLILAPGARDLALSFPGWELPGVLGARGAIALMTQYHALTGHRMVILGSGNLGLHTALLAVEHGIEVAGIVDVSLEVRGGAELWARLASRGVPFFAGHTVKDVRGDKEVHTIRLVRVDTAMQPVAGSERELPCDTVCLALGLVPNVELPYLTGCRLSFRSDLGGWIPDRNEGMQTSLEGVYVVGDAGGVHGQMVTSPDLATAQGRTAAIKVAQVEGFAERPAQVLEQDLSSTAGVSDPSVLGADCDRWIESLVAAGGMDVVVCHCEGVTRRELLDIRPPKYLAASAPGQWETKLSTLSKAGPVNPDMVKRLTRAGMGHCQGRRCREQVALLLSHATGVALSQVPLASYRPPVRPLPMKILWPEDEPEEIRRTWASWFRPWIKDPSHA
jgi:thioredoxin reductase